MIRWLALAGIIAMGVAAVAVSERRKVDVPVGPAAVLYLVADTEQELSRMPVRFTRMSDDEEISAGDELARGYSDSLTGRPDADTAEIQAYVTQVGSQLATNAHRPLPYKFHYIPDRNLVNAFALPGGHVYIGGGMLALMDSEDELAAVLGHEIEHIDHYHCAERVQQERALRRIPLGGLLSIPVEIFEAGYSKDQELEADREGTRLAVQAGYSPNGAIRMFEAFQRLYDESHARARTPQGELSQATIDALEGYFRSHPLPSERIAQINTMIASENWPLHAERDLAVAYVFWTARAKDALDAGKYSEAQQLAARSLQMRADQGKALMISAEAQFAQADFVGAASSYRKLLEVRGWTIEVADSYARALAAANRQTAANEFRQWMASTKIETQQLQAPLDGLLLLAGDPAPARKRQAELGANLPGPSTPHDLSELGWWSYVAGDYARAAEMLNQAVQLRPDNANMLVRLTWAEIELRQFADAFRTINSAESNPSGSRAEQNMAEAVARWQAQEREVALRDFAAAAGSQPEWENPRWVGALYSPLVAQSIQEMQAERERRRKAALAAQAHPQP
ncbi:MAG: M48 family metalloprotease [Acidobacteriia bacterium]|nr:M48 family metalloprotease [Terriglobia bacterium]